MAYFRCSNCRKQGVADINEEVTDVGDVLTVSIHIVENGEGIPNDSRIMMPRQLYLSDII